MSKWTEQIENFSPITVTNDTNTVKVEWEYIGEGWYGDFDPTDLTDDPLLRFSVSVKDGDEWEYAEDASYCTQNEIDTDPNDLREIGVHIIRAFEECVQEGRGWKQEMANASWWTPDPFYAE